jgi:hypothetical protein
MDLKKKKKYEDEIIELIKKHKIVFFNHVFAFTSFSSSTAYNYELEKLETIKSIINQNKSKAKNYLVNKWIASDNATLQISAYRLMSDSEEHQKLNQSYIDHTSKGKEITSITRTIIDESEHNNS